LLHIATHNGIFHADEISAIALLEIFVDEVDITRVPHNTKNFDNFDMIIDIGRKYDGEKYFDHHQYKGGKSSAGLIWEFIGKEKEYPKISTLVKLIDKHDVGEKRAKEFEYPNIIKCFNTTDIYSKKQEEAFLEAVAFAKKVFLSLKEASDAVIKAKEIVANSYVFDNNPAIIELQRFTPHWNSYINGEKTPHIKTVVWEDEATKKWYAKIPPKRAGSFELVAPPFKKDSSMEFIHSSGFLAVAQDEDILKRYLKSQRM